MLASPEGYADQADRAESPELAQFFAIISDALSHGYLDGLQFWPDTWSTMKALYLECPDVQIVVNADEDLAHLFVRLWAFGVTHGYEDYRG